MRHLAYILLAIKLIGQIDDSQGSSVATLILKSNASLPFATFKSAIFFFLIQAITSPVAISLDTRVLLSPAVL